MMNKNTLHINKTDGTVTIKNYAITLYKGTSRDEVGKVLTPLYRSNIDYKNGTEWMFFEEIEFSECPCNLGLYFEQGMLTQLKIHITPIHSDRSSSGWSSDKSVDEAVLLSLIEFRIQLSRPFKEGRESFDWGEIWSVPDYKRSEMDSGLKWS